MKKFDNKNVKAVFDAQPKKFRAPLLDLRKQIFDIAKEIEEVGVLTEELKWGQPTYSTIASNSGTPLRLDRFGEDKIGLYVHCQTSLVETYRNMFPHMECSKSRALILDPEEEMPLEELGVFIEMALTYKLRKKDSKKKVG